MSRRSDKKKPGRKERTRPQEPSRSVEHAGGERQADSARDARFDVGGWLLWLGIGIAIGAGSVCARELLRGETEAPPVTSPGPFGAAAGPATTAAGAPDALLPGAEDLVGPKGELRPGAKRGRLASDGFPHQRNGQALFERQRYTRAFQEFRRAAELAPDDPRPYFGLGEVFRNLDRGEQAAKAYRWSLRADGTYLGAKLQLANVLCELGQNEESNRLLDEVAKVAPGDSNVWAQRAKNAMRLGKPEVAVAQLELYNAAKGKQAWGYANLGRAYAAIGRTGEAERAFRVALEIDPKHVLGNLWFGQLLVANGRQDEATKILDLFQELRRLQGLEQRLERALLRRPNSATVLANLAMTRYRLGEYRDADVVLKRALELQPNHAELRDLERKLREALGNSGR